MASKVNNDINDEILSHGTLIPVWNIEIGKLQDHLSKVSNIFLWNVITEQLEKSRFRVKTRLKPGTSHEPKLIMSKSC